MFHVTRKEDLASILANGLEPRLGPRSQECGEIRPAVFLFPTREALDTAMPQWLGECFEDVPDDGLSILEVVPAADAQLHSDVAYEVSCLTRIPPGCITQVFSEDWVPQWRMDCAA